MEKKTDIEDKENDGNGEGGKGNLGEEEVVDDRLKNCLLTNGVLPLLRQTDRLALESIGKLSRARESAGKLITSPYIHQIQVHQPVRQLPIPLF
jgi:hypothetical protein